MGSVPLFVALFLMVLASRRNVAEDLTHTSEFGETEDVWRWNVEDYPNPQIHPRYCQRYSSSNVCDPDGVLTKEQANDLDLVVRELYNQTPCLCPECPSASGGIVVGIAVMKHIFLPYNEYPSVIIRKFAEGLRLQWSLGQCQNDIIIVLVTKDRLASTSFGPGISSHISSQELKIFGENKGHFAVGKYYEGLLSMVLAYHTLSLSIKFSSPVLIGEINAGLVAGVVVGIVLFVVLVVLVACTLHRRMTSRSPSLRRESWTGDPSLSWRKTQYHPCNTQDSVVQKVAPSKCVDTENNNDQVIKKDLQEHALNTGNEAQLTTVVEIENEEKGTPKEESEGEEGILITHVSRRDETEMKYTEVEMSSPCPQAINKETVTNP